MPTKDEERALRIQRARAFLKASVLSIVPISIALSIYNLWVRLRARRLGLLVSSDSAHYCIGQGERIIRISKRQALFLSEVVEHFEFYFSAVTPIHLPSVDLVDYSTPRWHGVMGFDSFPIFFPSFAEPIVTAQQYIELANLPKDAVVLDLGAYSGLTSILLDQSIPSGGCVVAVEADQQNIQACRENIAIYERFSAHRIILVEAAVWKNDEGVCFSSEGNMSSSAVEIVGQGRGINLRVPTLTLLQLARQQHLSRVDFIKCDIEGGETQIFNSPEFFALFKPRIIIECHVVDGVNTANQCQEILSKFGYMFDLVEQHGYPLPLLVCSPGRLAPPGV